MQIESCTLNLKIVVLLRYVELFEYFLLNPDFSLGLLGVAFNRYGDMDKLKEDAMQHLFDVSRLSVLKFTNIYK